MSKYSIAENKWTTFPSSPVIPLLNFRTFGNTNSLRIALDVHNKKMYQFDPKVEEFLERPDIKTSPKYDVVHFSLIVSDENLDCLP